MTQSIIVYRNPIEEAVGRQIGNGTGLDIIASIIVGCLAAVLATTIYEKVWRRFRKGWNTPHSDKVAIATAIVGVVATLTFLAG